MTTQAKRIKLGSQGLAVSAQGLHCMSMTRGHYDAPAILRYLEIDGSYRERVQLATKFGIKVIDETRREVCGHPAYARAACEVSLKRLDVDYIDLYYQHRIDTRVPIEVTIGELKKLVEEGRIKYIGLSEASPSTIRRAHALHPITAVQMEWSLWTRDIEDAIVPTCRHNSIRRALFSSCVYHDQQMHLPQFDFYKFVLCARELGIGIVAYSPLGRGFFSKGPKVVESFPENDYRRSIPRFQPENLEHNKHIFEQVNAMALKKGCMPSQLALAWLPHQGNGVCPIPGTTNIEDLNQNIGALSVKLTPEEIVELESFASAENVKGERSRDITFSWKASDTPPLSSWNGE
ncbi:hypothetical protein Drorol1_Dr00012907 [Drosera rotundifolia]